MARTAWHRIGCEPRDSDALETRRIQRRAAASTHGPRTVCGPRGGTRSISRAAFTFARAPTSGGNHDENVQGPTGRRRSSVSSDGSANGEACKPPRQHVRPACVLRQRPGRVGLASDIRIPDDRCPGTTITFTGPTSAASARKRTQDGTIPLRCSLPARPRPQSRPSQTRWRRHPRRCSCLSRQTKAWSALTTATRCPSHSHR